MSSEQFVCSTRLSVPCILVGGYAHSDLTLSTTRQFAARLL